MHNTLNKAIHKKKTAQLNSKNLKRNKIVPIPNLTIARNKTKTVETNTHIVSSPMTKSEERNKGCNIEDLLAENKSLREEIQNY